MGCDGCELYPTIGKIRETIVTVLSIKRRMRDQLRSDIEALTAPGPQTIHRNLVQIANLIAEKAAPDSGSAEIADVAHQLQDAVKKLFICYAGTLHRFFNANGRAKGYAFPFEKPKEFPGRVGIAAHYPIPTESEISLKPWLDGLKRLIFISDMGDALSRSVPFEFLRDEVIVPVDSPAGRRHMWLWLTKRPARMADFSEWLSAQGISWPEHLVPMTSITSSATVNRVAQLKRVAAAYHALSVEPLWDDVSLPLHGIDWVIVGGQSGAQARPFHVEWAERIMHDCRASGSAFFLKQLGRRPFRNGVESKLNDEHGGDWAEWPRELRVREFPLAWRVPSQPSVAIAAAC